MNEEKIIGIYKGFGDKLLYKNEILTCQKVGIIEHRCCDCALNYTKRITDDDVKRTLVSCDDVICRKNIREKVSHSEFEHNVIFKRKYHIYVEGKPIYVKVGELISVEGKLYKCVEDIERELHNCGCEIPSHIKCTKLFCSKAERNKIFAYDAQTHVIFKRYYRNPILRLFKYLHII